MLKMIEDRKRASENLVGESSKKRKPLDSLSEEGPLTQSDVVYFKKEAIWRQMKGYKEECYMLSKDLITYKNLYELNEKKLSILDEWYKQVIGLFSEHQKELSDELNENLLVKFTDDCPVEEVLSKRREQLLKYLTRLNQNLNHGNADSNELQRKIEEINSQLHTVIAENESLKNFRDKIVAQNNELNEKLLKLAKNNLRNDSITVKRVDDSIRNGSIKKELDDKNEEMIKDEKTKNEENNINTEAVEKMTNEINELRSLNKVVKEQLENTSIQFKNTENEKMKLIDRLSNLTKEDLDTCVIYRELKSNNESLKENLTSLRQVYDSTVEKLKELESYFDNSKELINKAVIEENKNLRSQLDKSESDLIRIRTTRDELLSKQTILKSEIESKQTNEEVNKLNKILNERLSSLENSKDITIESSNLDGLSKEDLIKRINMLQVEIKEIEVAFQESRELSLKKLTSAIENENMVKKLTIEKTKADQKYFASMRSKDALVSENKLLKVQVAKSQELINKFNEIEKNYQKKIENLSSSLNDYQVIRQTTIDENVSLKELNKTAAVKLNTAESELTKLKERLKQSMQEFNDAKDEIKMKSQTIAKLESNLKSTESLLKKYKSNNTSSILHEDEKQLEALRSIAKCSVCSKNWNDTAITVCGHVFCHNCTQERLAARLRRCPTCNKGFSINDLLSIHL